MDWKAQLEGGDGAITKLQGGNSAPGAKIIRDGVGWFLESTEFSVLTDHLEVREKAKSILHSLVSANGLAGAGANIVIGSVIRIHYDNSKSVFRAEG